VAGYVKQGENGIVYIGEEWPACSVSRDTEDIISHKPYQMQSIQDSRRKIRTSTGARNSSHESVIIKGRTYLACWRHWCDIPINIPLLYDSNKVHVKHVRTLRYGLTREFLFTGHYHIILPLCLLKNDSISVKVVFLSTTRRMIIKVSTSKLLFMRIHRLKFVLYNKIYIEINY
jgi:hypothetical protein